MTKNTKRNYSIKRSNALISTTYTDSSVIGKEDEFQKSINRGTEATDMVLLFDKIFTRFGFII
jgi:glutamate-1-semialdehyde aminotransferase